MGRKAFLGAKIWTLFLIMIATSFSIFVLGNVAFGTPDNTKSAIGGGKTSLNVGSFEQRKMKLVDYDETQDLKIVGNVSFSGDGGKAMEDQTLLLLKLFWLDDSVHKIVRKSSYGGAELDLNPSVRMISSVAEPDKNGVTGFSFVTKLAAKDYHAGDVVEMTTSSSLMNFVSRGAFNLRIPKDDKFEDWVDVVSVQLFDKTETTTLGEKFGIGNKVFLPKGMKLNGVELKKHTWIRVIDGSGVVGYDVGTSVKLPGEQTDSTLGTKYGEDVYVKLPAGTILGKRTLTEATWVRIEEVSGDSAGYGSDISVQLPNETVTTLGERFGEGFNVKLPKGTKLNGVPLTARTWVYVKPIIGYDVETPVQESGKDATKLGTYLPTGQTSAYVKLPAGTKLNEMALGTDTLIKIEDAPEENVADFDVYDDSTTVKLSGQKTTSTINNMFGKDIMIKLPKGTVLGNKTLDKDTWIKVESAPIDGDDGYAIGYHKDTKVVDLTGDGGGMTLDERFGIDVYVKLPAGMKLNDAELIQDTWIWIVEKVPSGNFVTYSVDVGVCLPNGVDDVRTLGTIFGKDICIKLPKDMKLNGKQLSCDTWIGIEEEPTEVVDSYDRETRCAMPNGIDETLDEIFGSGIRVKLPAGTVLNESTLNEDTWIGIDE